MRSASARLTDLLFLAPLPPPRPTPPKRPAWAGPSRFYLERGVRREAADSPSSKSPGGTPTKHPTAGRRPVALKEETHRAKQMEGNTRRETGVSSTPASLRRLRLCRCSTTPPAMAPSVAGGADFRSSRSARVPLAQVSARLDAARLGSCWSSTAGASSVPAETLACRGERKCRCGGSSETTGETRAISVRWVSRFEWRLIGVVFSEG